MRKFSVYNSSRDVAEHVAKIKTLQDLRQIEFDIKASETNLCYFMRGNPGVWAIDCCADGSDRHVFMTKDAVKRYAPSKKELAKYASFTVLE